MPVPIAALVARVVAVLRLWAAWTLLFLEEMSVNFPTRATTILEHDNIEIVDSVDESCDDCCYEIGVAGFDDDDVKSDLVAVAWRVGLVFRLATCIEERQPKRCHPRSHDREELKRSFDERTAMFVLPLWNDHVSW